MNHIPNKGYTHSGVFHCDDVFSTALLKILNPNIKIKRVANINEIPKNEKEDIDYIVYDIGQGKFDHHQKNKKTRYNGAPYAAFGLLWKQLGHLLFEKKIVDEFDMQFIQQLDISDNDGTYNSLCDAIKSFNNINQDNNNKEFDEAVSFAKKILENKINKLEWEVSILDENKKLIKETKEDYVVLNKYVPPKLFSNTHIKIVIYPSNRDAYHVQIVPKSNLQFSSDFKNVDEITIDYPSFIFCNEKRYLIACKDIDDAIKIAKNAI